MILTKLKVFLIILVFVNINCYSQKDSIFQVKRGNNITTLSSDSLLYSYPQFIGEEKALQEYFINHFDSIIQDCWHGGTIWVQTTIDSLGQPQDFLILRNFGCISDSMVLEALKMMPVWRPALNNEKKPIDVILKFPIYIRLK